MPAKPAAGKGKLFGMPTGVALLAVAIGVLFVVLMLRKSPQQASQQDAGSSSVPQDVAAATAGQPQTVTPASDLLSTEVAGIFGLLNTRLAALGTPAAPPTPKQTGTVQQSANPCGDVRGPSPCCKAGDVWHPQKGTCQNPDTGKSYAPNVPATSGTGAS